jgi:hypothetical protein
MQLRRRRCGIVYAEPDGWRLCSGELEMTKPVTAASETAT